MKSWQTTVAGILTSVGLALSNMEDPAWMAGVGQVLMGVSVAFMGIVARDNNKSSEEVK